jgi:biotin carboxyl carrier protein
MAAVTVIRIGEGAYRVEHDGRQDVVFVAGTSAESWAFWNGHVFRTAGRTAPDEPGPDIGPPPVPHPSPTRPPAHALTAPMPATVIKVLVTPGATVKSGDTLLLLEAMKMELPIRAPADAVVTAVHCREGDLVQPDVALVEFQS